jgi:hypothetical protein
MSFLKKNQPDSRWNVCTQDKLQLVIDPQASIGMLINHRPSYGQVVREEST